MMATMTIMTGTKDGKRKIATYRCEKLYVMSA